MPPCHATSPSQALYRIFVAPTLSPRTLAPLPHHHHHRFLSTTLPRPAKTRPPEARAQKWDEEITSRYLTLVDSTTDKLSPTGPVTRYDTLHSFDRATHRLIQVSPDEPHNPDFIPVCKIVSKKSIYEADKKRREARKVGAGNSAKSVEAGSKTLELNWAIDQGNDLTHRLERVEAFLREGRRVEVVLAAKKRGRKASLGECEGVLRRIREAVGRVEGAGEVRGLEGKVGGVASLVVQGKVGKAKPMVARDPDAEV